MHRFYLAPEQCRPPSFALTGSEAHHAQHVLRVRRGEHVHVLDGAGTEYACEVVECRRGEMELRMLEKKSTPPLPWRITLLQALPKGKLFESIIQKATELGVVRIVPLLAERVIVHLDPDSAADKRDKWQNTAIEAIKQCGSPWLTRVDTPTTPQQFLQRQEQFDLPLLGSLQPGAQHPREHFREFERQHRRRPVSVCVWIGPEGDFAPDEIAMILAGGAKPITLGRLVLRVETAALYCAAIINYELSARE